MEVTRVIESHFHANLEQNRRHQLSTLVETLWICRLIKLCIDPRFPNENVVCLVYCCTSKSGGRYLIRKDALCVYTFVVPSELRVCVAAPRAMCNYRVRSVEYFDQH